MIDRAYHAELALRCTLEAGYCESIGHDVSAGQWMEAAHWRRELAGVPARAPDLAAAWQRVREHRIKYPFVTLAWREANRS